MNNQKKIAYLISNIEEYGKFLSFLINNDVNVYRLYWDERAKGDRCYQIDWKEKNCYYDKREYYEDNGYEIIDNVRECYIDGCWNKDNSDDYLTEIEFPVRKK